MMMIRHLQDVVEQRLQRYSTVALLGPHQVGKTTLTKAVATNHPDAIVLDMEREPDRAVLTRPELFLLAPAPRPAHRAGRISSATS